MPRSTFLLIALFAAAVFVVGCTERSSSNTATQPAPTAEAPTYRPAPPFERLTLSGDSVRLADRRGRIVVINFWATWCGPCRAEIPNLIALQNEFGVEKVRFIGVALDEEGEAVVRPYAEEMGINYPLITEEALSLAEAYGGHYAVPTTFVIDRQGRIRQRYMRAVEEHELRTTLRDLLAEG